MILAIWFMIVFFVHAHDYEPTESEYWIFYAGATICFTIASVLYHKLRSDIYEYRN